MVAVITAAAMMPVASPATQWMVEPRACFQRGTTNAWWLCPAGFRHDARYSTSPTGPV